MNGFKTTEHVTTSSCQTHYKINQNACMLHISILSDIDDQIEYYDEMTCAFNVLRISNIKISGNIDDLATIIDLNKLIEETNNYNENKLLNFNYYSKFYIEDTNLLINEKVKDSYIRFIWWFANEILYNQPHTNNIDISKISKSISNPSLNSIKYYIVNHGEHSNMYFSIRSANVYIEFKNIKPFLSNSDI